jgi:hypothetical protein
MSLLLDFEASILDHAKAMPDKGMAEEVDFETWGKDFCKKMVSSKRFRGVFEG